MIRPLPKVKQSLSDPAHLPHIVQLLLTFDPILVEKVATLLHLVLEDNSRLPTLYLSGCFFFILMYTGFNLLPIGRFLALSHNKVKFQLYISYFILKNRIYDLLCFLHSKHSDQKKLKNLRFGVGRSLLKCYPKQWLPIWKTMGLRSLPR